VVVDEVAALLPLRREAAGDVRVALDEIAGDRAAGRKRVAVLVAEDVLGDDPGLQGARYAELAHGRGLRLERIARIEGAAGHDIDVLTHVELVDRVVALVEPDLGEHRLGSGQGGETGGGHDARTLEILERRGRIARTRHELLHLIDSALAVHADIHGDAGLLDIGVHCLDGDEHDRRLDLIADHRREIGRTADKPDGLGLDVLLFEKPALDRDEVGQGRGGREQPALDLLLRGGALPQGGCDGEDRPQRHRPDPLHRIPSIASGDVRRFGRTCRIRASTVRLRGPTILGSPAGKVEGGPLACSSGATRRPRLGPRSSPRWTVCCLTFGRDWNSQQSNGLYHWGKTVFTKRMLRSGRLGLVGPPAEERRHSWLERVIFGIDRALRRWQSVVEFTGDPSCILRIRIGRLDGDLALADGTSGRVGDRFVDLHLWNEQVPAMPREGASIAWARQMHVCFQQSLAQLARYLAE